MNKDIREHINKWKHRAKRFQDDLDNINSHLSPAEYAMAMSNVVVIPVEFLDEEGDE